MKFTGGIVMYWFLTGTEHGCPDVKEKDHKGVHYFPGHNVVCRGGYKNTTKVRSFENHIKIRAHNTSGGSLSA